MDTPIFQEHEDEEAFAKLQGRRFKHFIKKKTVILGREPGESTEQEQTIVIGNSLRISRRHIKIFWCDKDREWKILCPFHYSAGYILASSSSSKTR